MGNEFSTLKKIPAGVPQGSILGPVLFIIFNNDIPMNRNTKVALFADDTCIYATSWLKRNALSYLKEHAAELAEYFEDNKTKINEDKTEAIVFSHKLDACKKSRTVFSSDVPLKKKSQVLGSYT